MISITMAVVRIEFSSTSFSMASDSLP